MKLKSKEISFTISCIKLYRDILIDTITFETKAKDKKELKKIDKIIKKLEEEML